MADNPPTSKRSSAFKSSDDLPPPVPAAERDRLLGRALQRSRVLERRPPPEPAGKKK